MGIVNWTVLTTAMLIVIGIAFFCRRYIRNVADFFSAGRVTRRCDRAWSSVGGVSRLGDPTPVPYIFCNCRHGHFTGMGL